MRSRVRRGLLSFLLLAASCEASPSGSEDEVRPCLPTQSEFPPSACAQLIGLAQVPSGQRADTLVVVVDTIDTAAQRSYGGTPVPVGADGHFELLIYEVAPLGTPTPSDPILRTLELRVHRTTSDARQRSNVLSRHLIAMTFTPWGRLVTPTAVQISVGPP